MIIKKIKNNTTKDIIILGMCVAPNKTRTINNKMNFQLANNDSFLIAVEKGYILLDNGIRELSIAEGIVFAQTIVTAKQVNFDNEKLQWNILDDTLQDVLTFLKTNSVPPFHKEVDDLTLSSTQSTLPVNKLILKTDSIPAGKYRIGWHYVWRYSSTGNNFIAQIEIDDSNQIMYHEQEPQDVGSDIRHNEGGFAYVTFKETGSHSIDFDYWTESGSRTSYVYSIRLEFWKVD